MPEDVRVYLEELVRRLRGVLGDRLVSVAAIGSVALDAYVPGTSDLDVMVVVDDHLDPERRAIVIDRCAHSSLPCPARKLELVVYTRAQVASPAREQRWEINLNTGPGEHVAETDPRLESWHWFVLDLAQARQHAVTLHGPPIGELVGAVPYPLVREAFAEGLAWGARHEPGPSLMLAAARAWHWHATGAFTAKDAAWRWARERLG